jgi:hypothetical protein
MDHSARWRSSRTIGVALSLAWAATGHAVSQDGTRFIPQADHYIEFKADVDRVRHFANAPTRMQGSVYRSSDGSLRWEWFDANRRVDSIVLRSVKDNVLYSWNNKSGWRTTSVPASTDPSHPGPHPRAEKYFSRTVESIEGFEVFLHEYQNGGYSIEAPQLNFFPLVQRICGDDGTSCEEWRLSHIQVGPQSPELFERD